MKNKNSELIWKGSTHLGDEPGIFGNSSYSGLSFELPITLQSEHGDKRNVSFQIFTEFVKVFNGYKGHKVTISKFELDTSTSNPYDWKETILSVTHLVDSSTKEIQFEAQGKTLSVSIRIEIDTTVTPGLYDDFLFTQVNFMSSNFDYYAKLGF